MRSRLALSLPLVVPALFPAFANAQNVQRRQWNSTIPLPLNSGPIRLAQIDIPSSPRNTAPTAPAPVPDAEGNLPDGATVRLPGGRKPISYSVDTRFGFDKNRVFVPDLVPFQIGIKRRIRTVVFSGSYPLSTRSRFSVNVPYISQSTRSSANGRSFTQRGNGVGDISLWLDHSIPNAKKQVELMVAAGLIVPTGRNPFNLGANQLETGLGFYQPVARISVRSLRVPLQFFGALDYSTSFSRSFNGVKRKLPASYGGEVGFFYSLGPEWGTQTSLSLGKSSSPVLQDSGTSVGYLTQALNYRTGDRTSFRASVDVGLTDDSTDAYVGLSMNSSF